MVKTRWPVANNIITYAVMTVGTAIAAFGIDFFLVPNKLAPGGVSGFSTVIYHLTGMSVGTISLIVNIPLFVLGIWREGKDFGIKSIYSTVSLSLFLDLLKDIEFITDDYVLASLYGGLLVGVGLGIVFLMGATTGGTDIIAKLVKRGMPWLSIGKILLITDITIIAFATVVFNNLYTGLYSIISLFASTLTIDAMLDGVDYAKTVFIITDKYKEVSQSVLNNLSRGVTGLCAQGMYTGADKMVLLCSLKTNELPKLKDIVREIDPSAFVILADVREVIGDGFKKQ